MRPFAAALALASLVAFTTNHVSAADSEDMVSIPRSQWENLQLNAREFQRLTNEIASLKAEIKKLKEGSSQASSAVAASPELEAELAATKLQLQEVRAQSAAVAEKRPSRAEWIHPAAVEAASKAPPTPDMATLPALTPETVVSAVDLIHHFQKDPVAAEARYKKKSFLLQGVVAELDKSTTSRNYDVIFRQPGTVLKAKVKTTPPARFDVTVLVDDRASIEGRTSGEKTRLVEAGQTVILTCRCESFSKNTITLSDIASDKK